MRRFNWKFLIVFIIALAVVGGMIIFLRQRNHDLLARQGLERGNLAYQRQDYVQATNEWFLYLQRNPADNDLWIKYAQTLLDIRPRRSENIKLAQRAYRTVLMRDPGQSKVAISLMQMYLKMGAPEEAEFIARKTLPIRYEPEVHLLLAQSLIDRREYKTAAKELAELLAQQPNYVPAYEKMGLLAENQPEIVPTPAAGWFAQAISGNPQDLRAYLTRASFLYRHGDPKGALRDLETAEKLLIETGPQAIEQHLELAQGFYAARDPDRTRRHLDRCREIDAGHPGIWELEARIAQDAQDKAQVLQVIEQAFAQLNKSTRWDFIPLATELYIQYNEYGRAQALIEEMRKNEIALEITEYFEGIMADRQDRVKEAYQHLRKAMETNVQTVKARLAYASVCFRFGDSDTAINQLQLLAKEEPDSFSVRMTFAQILSQIGSLGPALEQVRAALAIAPDSLEAAEFALQTQLQLLEYQQAPPSAPEWDQVKTLLEQVAKKAPQDETVQLLQFQAALQRRDDAVAQATIEKLLTVPQPSLNARLAEVVWLRNRDQIDPAIQRLDAIIKDHPDSFQAASNLLIFLAQKNQWDRFLAVLDQGFDKLDPVDLRALGLLAIHLYQPDNRAGQGQQILERLAQKLPDDIPIKRQLLRQPAIMASPQRSRELIEQIRALEGENGWQTRYEDARFLFNQPASDEQENKIITLLKANLTQNPTEMNSGLLLGALYERRGDMGLALSIYRELYERRPDDLAILVPLVAALNRTGEYENANELLRRAASQRITDPSLVTLQLQNAIFRGDWETGVRLIETDPNSSSQQEVRLLLATLKTRQGQFEEAQKILDQLNKENPENSQVQLARIELRVRQSDPAGALAICEELIIRDPRAESYLVRARAHDLLDQVDQARADYIKALALKDTDYRIWLNKCEFEKNHRNLPEALAAVSKALNLAPQDLSVQKVAISLFLAMPDPALVRRGKDLLNQALQAHPQERDLQVQQAVALLQENTNPAAEQAQNILTRVVTSWPQTDLAWLLLGNLALEQNNSVLALDYALRGLSALPNHPKLLLLKARAESVHSPEAAQITLKSLHEKYPKDVEILQILANSYIAGGASAAAVDLLTEHLAEFDPENARVFRLLRAEAQYKAGAKEKALQELDQLFTATPADAGPLMIQARLLRQDHNWKTLRERFPAWSRVPFAPQLFLGLASELLDQNDPSAQSLAQEIIAERLKTAPDDINLLLLQAQALQQTQKAGAAQAVYQQIIEKQPGNYIALNNLAWILSESAQQYPQALELVDRGIKAAPDNYIDIYDTRGMIYYRLGQFDRAVQDFLKCVRIFPRGAPGLTASYFHLGRALSRIPEQRQHADEHLKHALELNRQLGGLTEAEKTEAQQMCEQLAQGV